MDHLREWNGIVLLCTVQQGLLVYWYLFLSLWTSVQGWYTNKDPTRLFTESTLSLASWALGFPWESKRHNGYFFGSETIWYSVDRGLYKGLLCQRHSLRDWLVYIMGINPLQLISRTQAQPQWSQRSQRSQRADSADLRIASIKVSISHSCQTGGMELLTTDLLSSLQYFVRHVYKVMRILPPRTRGHR